MTSTAIKDLLEQVMSSSGALAYPVMLPQGVKEGMTYTQAGGSSEPTLDGSGPQRLRLQVDCFAPAYLEADAMRGSLVAGLNGFQGTLSDGTVVTFTQFLQPIDYFENFVQDFRCGAEFYLNYSFNR